MDKIKYTIFNIIILILGVIALVVGYNWNKVPLTIGVHTATSSDTSSTSSDISTIVSTVPVTATTSDTSWMKNFTVVTADEQNQTIALSYAQRFVIDLGGNLSWSLSFTPDGSITRVPDSTTADGVQGVYEADGFGTSTLEAIGAPMCNATGACPQFRRAVTINFIISPNQ